MNKINTEIDIYPERIKKILDNFKGKKIAIIGDIMLDEYYWGNVNRVSPEAPVPIVKYISKNNILGGATNVANNIITLGGDPLLIGIAGDDYYGKTLTSVIKKRGINTEGIIKDESRITTVKTRIIAHNQQMLRIDREDTLPINNSIKNRIIKIIKKNLKTLDGVLISDYAKGVITFELLEELIPLLNDNNIFIAVDPQVKHFSEYKNVSILTPNNYEAGQGIGIEIVDQKTLIEAGRKIMRKLKCKSLLITQGEDGMTLFDNSDKITHIPTVAKHVYDVTGAGDTVISTFILCISSGASLLESAFISNHAAGIVVGEVGTSTITLAQLKKEFGIN
ncbi:MAG: D-glycero-beta-D-manno-heptose-7-phosphate kinase [Candidatus Firestonebacteria bacterium]|nr:D-glycero-beta-D-manno-heptose-7-phosphate kinase [Candidatus Firestonebacteria bacterium]